MKVYRIIIGIFIIVNNLSASLFLQGSGATLSESAYFTWSYYFYKEKSIPVYYESIGSFPGIKKLELNSIDFASSDKSLDEEELKKKELVQFPLLMTSIDIVHNIKGIKNNSLKLTNKIISKIYRGEIEYWDNSSITNLNKTIKLPHRRIVVVIRNGNSGTTYYFTKHLSQTTKDWNKIGITKNLKLPNVIYGIKNEGVALKIKDIPYSIGYLPSPYRIINELSSIRIQNLEGEWKETLDIDYPIKALNYVITTKRTIKENKAFAEFFNWIFKSGDQYIEDLGYIPLDSHMKKEYYNIFSY